MLDTRVMIYLDVDGEADFVSIISIAWASAFTFKDSAIQSGLFVSSRKGTKGHIPVTYRKTECCFQFDPLIFSQAF